MKLLFQIPLIGAGTFEVESLASYVHRCAFIHGLSVGPLLKYVFQEMQTRLGRLGFAVLPKHFDVSEIVRPNMLAYTFATYLGEMTGQDLEAATFLKLESAVGRTEWLVRRGFMWCPECYAEDLFRGNDPYIRLIWHLSELTHCPLHRTPLISTCEGCGCNQMSFHRNNKMHICQHCGRTLAERIAPLKFYDLAKSWQSHAEDLLQLVGDLAKSSKQDLFNKEGLNLSLTSLLRLYRKNGREDEFWNLLSRDTLHRVMFRGYPISLGPIRRIAFQLGVPIGTLLSGQIQQTSQLFDWKETLPPSLRVRKKAPPRDHPNFLKRLSDLVSQKEVLSLEETARRLEVSVGYLQYRYPAMVKRIAEKYRKYRADQKVLKETRAAASAYAYFHAVEYAHCVKSRKEAYKVLSEITHLPKFVLKKAITQEYMRANSSE